MMLIRAQESFILAAKYQQGRALQDAEPF